MKVSITYDRKVGSVRYVVSIECFADIPQDQSYDKAIELFESARHAVEDQIRCYPEESSLNSTKETEGTSSETVPHPNGNNPPTQKQLNYIAVMARELNIDVDSDKLITSGDASALIEKLAAQRKIHQSKKGKK